MLGGFIWDWVDQGLYQTLPDGSVQVSYGGDWDERPNSGGFCLNGVILCDRSTTPKWDEVRTVYQPFRISLGGTSPIEIEILNRNFHVGTGAFALKWCIEREGVLVEKGECGIPAAAPGETASLAIAPKKLKNLSGNVYLTVAIVLREDALWAPAGWEVAAEQFPLSEAALAAATPAVHKGPGPACKVDGSGGDWEISGRNFSQVWKGGSLVSLVYKGRQLLSQDPASMPGSILPALQLYRAPTDNDAGFGNWLAKDWRNNGLDRPESRLVSASHRFLGDGRLELSVVTRNSYAQGGMTMTSVYLIDSYGSIEASHHFSSDGTLPVLPRLGVAWPFAEELKALKWFGLGPQETYPDRLRAARMGLWTSDVDSQLFPYPRPQESGNHERSSRIVLTDARGHGVRICALDESFSFSALPYLVSDLDAARHPGELTRRHATLCSIDAGQLGLGNSSCGPGVLKKYLVTGDSLHYIIDFL